MQGSYAYYADASRKTRLLNRLRRIFQWRPLEHLLAKTTQGRPASSFPARLVPHEYLYPKGSWRQVTRNGFQWELDLGDAVDHYIYFGFAEPGFDRMFRHIRPTSHVLDVGANIGMLSLPFARAAVKGRIWSFEPDPVNRTRLEQHLTLNHLTNVTVMPMGLGEQPGSFNLYKVVGTNSGMNRILSGAAAMPDLPHTVVPVERLDDLWPGQGSPRIDVMKVDVEGFEMAVLKGAGALIERDRPVLFIEVVDRNLRDNGSSAVELIDWLLQRGYSVVEAESGRSIERSALEGCSMDVLCTVTSS